ncbi:MAG: hypothetical protein AAGB04_17735, partial [Pseudomonadota bacterium]
ASDHFAISVDVPTEISDWGARLAEFAQAKGVDTIVTAYASVGPVAQKLAIAKEVLAEHGVALVEKRRAYDDFTWPHAHRGFFALKKKIPAILEDLQRNNAPQLL